MISQDCISLLTLVPRLIWSRQNPDGGTTYYYYSEESAWVFGLLALVWLALFLVNRYRRLLSLRRRPGRSDRRLLRQIIRIKNELSSRYLAPGFSSNIHAIGIGLLGDAYCIQVFIEDSARELWNGSGATRLPNEYQGVALVLFEMARMEFLSTECAVSVHKNLYPHGIREFKGIIIGGISGANANLTRQSGTLGYFCRRRTMRSRCQDTYLLSNTHVLANLQRQTVDASDLIVQPSPGEIASNRPIASLVAFSPLKFHRDHLEPNRVDAAIARLWDTQQYQAVLPLIGQIKGIVSKKDIEIGETACKSGRTTGFTEGSVLSIYLDIWIGYSQTGQTAYFKDQLLIEPALPEFQKFVAPGDSGSLLVDGQRHALGLLFAGASDAPTSSPIQEESAQQARPELTASQPGRVDGCGVANPISDVLDQLKIELLI